jgi:hypothetical protein
MQGRARKPKLLSKYPSLKTKATSKVKTPSRSPSPSSSESSSQSKKSTIVSPSRSAPKLPPMSKDKENDAKDEKSIVKLMKSTMPKFSNEADWEMAIFELDLVLDRVWPHKDELDIMDYMTSFTHRRSGSGDMEARADRPQLRKTPMPNYKFWHHVIKKLYHVL